VLAVENQCITTHKVELSRP